jgi:hypothetical protein
LFIVSLQVGDQSTQPADLLLAACASGGVALAAEYAAKQPGLRIVVEVHVGLCNKWQAA